MLVGGPLLIVQEGLGGTPPSNFCCFRRRVPIMGLAGDPTTGAPTGEKLPTSDPSRPPRLSRRDRDSYCFHLDFSAESQHVLPNLVRYVLAYGAKYSAFLDINVTHIITDKPLATVQSSAMVRKLGCKVLSLAGKHDSRPN
jgi:hypothetical protein